MDKETKNFFDYFVKSNYTDINPYNIWREDGYTFIEINAVGFLKEEITIEIKNGSLIVSGKSAIDYKLRKYVVHNMARTQFRNVFTLVGTVEIVSATLRNGLLTLCLQEKRENGIIQIQD